MTIQIIYNEYPLNYDSQTGSFTVGNVVYGATSSAYGTIRRIDRNGTAGTLYLESISGTFQDNEVIYEATYEDELVTNGDMELDANWSDAESPTLNERSAVDKHGGTYSRHVTTDSNWDGCLQTLSLTETYFYKVVAWYKVVSGNIWIHLGTGLVLNNATDNSWTSTTKYIQLPTTNQTIYFRSYNGASEWYIDDVSVKKITNAALADGTVQDPITIDMNLDRKGVDKDFRHERNIDHSYSGKVQIINQYGIQEMSINAMFTMATYYKLIAWWSWARQGKLWAFTMDSTKTGDTTLDGGAASGQTTIPLTSTTDFSADDICLLKREDLDDTWEVIVIDSVSAGVSVTATENLKFNYTAGDSFKHLDYWPEVVSLDKNFRPTRTGAIDTTGMYWKHTFKFTEAL